MKIFERIASLRTSLGLSRERFAQLIDVSVNTLRAIETKGVTPKSDVLEKISCQYPQVAAWLLIEDRVEKVEQETLDGFYSKKDMLQIVALANARSMEKLPIKPDSMRSLVLLQAIDDETTLSGIIQLSDWPSPTAYSENAHIMIKTGNLNLFSDHGGKITLETFKQWLQIHNKQLLESCTIQYSTNDAINFALAKGKFEGHIPRVALGHHALVDEAEKRFTKWKNN